MNFVTFSGWCVLFARWLIDDFRQMKKENFGACLYASLSRWLPVRACRFIFWQWKRFTHGGFFRIGAGHGYSHPYKCTGLRTRNADDDGDGEWRGSWQQWWQHESKSIIRCGLLNVHTNFVNRNRNLFIYCWPMGLNSICL